MSNFTLSFFFLVASSEHYSIHSKSTNKGKCFSHNTNTNTLYSHLPFFKTEFLDKYLNFGMLVVITLHQQSVSTFLLH